MHVDEEEIQRHLDTELGRKLHMSTLLKDQIPTIRTRGLDSGNMLVRSLSECDLAYIPFRCVPKTRHRVIIFEHLGIEGVAELSEEVMEIAKNLALSTAYEILKDEDLTLRAILEGWPKVSLTSSDEEMHQTIREQIKHDLSRLIIHGRNKTCQMKLSDSFFNFYPNREFCLASPPDANPWLWIGKVGFEDNILTQVALPKAPDEQVEVTLYEGVSILRLESLQPAVEVEYLYSETERMIGVRLHITASTGFAVVDPSQGIKICPPPPA